MSAFELLHPALQHHIANSLGWSDLRPFQKDVIPPILAGQHLVVLAPTAGGKTEAAFFPALSRMLSEGWSGLSILYVCPIKALLNNLDVRLQRYCTLLGRSSALWHGDIPASARKRILQNPPDCLLTTPESLEVMLVSPNVNSHSLFANLQMVIIDEIHAFAGDDRGWHLLAVLERISRLAGRDLQRIGLSATVGNPEGLIDWLAGSSPGPREVILPREPSSTVADVQLDFVGSLQNAAIVISRLHQGEKRLVFVDSRSRAEQLGAALRQLEVTTFVTHSSLSQDQRSQAEEAFATRDNCVIVATSVLELGIDVGDLDRVIQIDSPTTVSSFLQRMGRSGRREGAHRNCLFLATKDATLLQAAGLLDLWENGYVEPVSPPVLPLHVLAQQLMALALQERGIGRANWFRWICRVPGFASISADQVEHLVDWMLERDILWDDSGMLAFGRQGEKTFGRKHFLALFSVFTSPPLFSILHGRQELGYVDQMTFLGKQDGPRVLLLAGRAWKVTHIDWQGRKAYVEATEARGRSRWKGNGAGLECRLSQSIKQILTSSRHSERWSSRAHDRIDEVRCEFGWLNTESTVLLPAEDNALEWWTFAGDRVNATLAHQIKQQAGYKVKHDSYVLTVEPPASLPDLEQVIRELIQHNASQMYPEVDEAAITGLKFSECIPTALAAEILERRLQDTESTRQILKQQLRVVV